MVKYKNIVIGGDITALMFAFINSYPIFFTNPQKPFRFDFLSPKQRDRLEEIQAGSDKEFGLNFYTE